MRVKNEARWIRDSVGSILPLCDRVILYDDGSTDGTADLVDGLPKLTVHRMAAGGRAPDEARDKNELVEAARRFGPDWILCVDGDEVLEPGGQAEILMSISSGDAPAYTLRIAYLWDRPDQIRVDGVYRNMTRPSLFQLSKTNGIFERTTYGQNFHCGSVPTDLRGRSMPSAATLKHYGYMERADRLRKFEWYNRVDPENRLEDCYRHMVIGDLPGLPARSMTRHAGPLELESYP